MPLLIAASPLFNSSGKQYVPTPASLLIIIGDVGLIEDTNVHYI